MATAPATTKPTQPLIGFSGTDKPQWDDYALCIHCGLCLNHCPTYRLWGMEADSPRGRVRQMLLVDQKQLSITENFVTHIDRCLDCRACESACPSGVPYGRLVESARAQIERQRPRGFFARQFRNLVHRKLLPYPGRIALLADVLKFYQRFGLQSLARKSGLLRLLKLESREALLPPMDDKYFFSQLGKTFPARGKQRARVAFFAGCIAQVSFAKLNEATIRVLTANGCEVVVPAAQRCCGALAVHAGIREEARRLARNNMKVFLAGEFDAIITNAAGCGSTLKEYAHLFSEDEESRARGIQFQGMVRDVTEYLDTIGWVAPLREMKLRVTYQDSCHLLHGQRIKDAPRNLILRVPGIEFVEMPLADHCCGSAGVYNVTEHETSMQLLEEKMHYAESTKAAVIVTANPGCLLQLRAGTQIHRTEQQVLHVVELLDRGLQQS
jgi:glycolate oxidase iron-sulfur subunit